ncbi:unnamed protein product, partial [marine sediment metagenome]
MPLPAVAGVILAAAGAQMGTVLSVIIGSTLSPALAPIADKGSQLAYSILPARLLPLADAVLLRYRGLIDVAAYDDELKKQGYDDERREYLYQVAENLLGVTELISLYRRGKLPEDELFIEGEKIKWKEARLRNLLAVTEVIPGAQDIISFAVREVYSPEIAAAF